jgi:hypothetical protein
MKSILRRTAIGFLSILIFSTLTAISVSAITPNPVLIFMGQEPFSNGGTNFIRYNYGVFNSADIPNDLFTAAPALPPCGKNKNSSRSWVDLFDQSGKRLFGFCSLGNNKDLNTIWFALKEDELPPSWIFIEINDRQTNTKFKSNLAETTM